MRSLNPIDMGFLSGERREMPMHVGSLLLFKPPPEADPNFLAQLYAECVAPQEFRAPFNQKLFYPVTRLGAPCWDEDPEFDIEYHIRHSALPSPGRYRELFVLVSRLHGTLLDRSRPLWECHVIEGLQSGQFALYAKLHHGLIDGIAGMRLLQSSLTEDPNERGVPFAWMKSDKHRKRASGASPKMSISAVAEMIQSQVGSLPGLTRALAKTAAAVQLSPDERMAFPFEAPRSVLNTKVTGARRFVAQSYSMERIRRVREAFDATVNDVILAMCASALRRYLEEYGGVPEKPLTAMAPVSVRPRDGDELGNATTAVFVNLGTHIADPVRRMETIQASMRHGKTLVKELSFNEVILFTMLLATPALTPTLLGLGSLLPATNVVISNVPGPQKTLYWNGAKLDGMYPVSIVYHGMAVNITVTSYAGSLDFGIVACRRSVPRVQRIIDFLEDGLAELEAISGARQSA